MGRLSTAGFFAALHFPLWVLVSLSLPVQACSCTNQQLSLPEAYARTPAIFTGRVINRASLPGTASYSQDFQLQEVFKGPVKTPTLVKTGKAPGGCGFPFEPGQEYLVFAYEDVDKDKYQTSLCTLTKPLAKASREIQSLRELKKANRTR